MFRRASQNIGNKIGNFYLTYLEYYPTIATTTIIPLTGIGAGFDATWFYKNIGKNQIVPFPRTAKGFVAGAVLTHAPIIVPVAIITSPIACGYYILNKK